MNGVPEWRRRYVGGPCIILALDGCRLPLVFVLPLLSLICTAILAILAAALTAIALLALLADLAALAVGDVVVPVHIVERPALYILSSVPPRTTTYRQRWLRPAQLHPTVSSVGCRERSELVILRVGI